MKEIIYEKLMYMIIMIIVVLLIIGSYKWQEWKLENIWGIQNPSFYQVLDSMRYRNRR